MHLQSRARAVVRECYKGDDKSQWEKGKFDPPPLKNPLTDGHQNLCSGPATGSLGHWTALRHAKCRPKCAGVDAVMSAPGDKKVG